MHRQSTTPTSTPCDSHLADCTARTCSTRACTIVGIVLSMQLVLAIVIKSANGEADDLWWLSYVSLALAAAAMLLRSIALTATLVTCLSIPHFMWLFDAIVGLTTARFPLQLTNYLPESGILQLLATSHHLYLWPLLCVMLLRMTKGLPRASLPRASEVAGMSMAIIASLILASRLCLPAAKNINFAFAVFPGVDEPLGHAINALPAPAYLLVLNLFALSLLVVPGRALAMTLMRAPKSVDSSLA